MTLVQKIHAEIAGNGGWLPFDRFMNMALYEPGLGYYAGGRRKFGRMPSPGELYIAHFLGPHGAEKFFKAGLADPEYQGLAQ